jgi:hypothetical protein
MVAPMIVEGILTGIQILSGLAQAAGVSQEEVKKVVADKYAELDAHKPEYLPDPPEDV